LKTFEEDHTAVEVSEVKIEEQMDDLVDMNGSSSIVIPNLLTEEPMIVDEIID